MSEDEGHALLAACKQGIGWLGLFFFFSLGRAGEGRSLQRKDLVKIRGEGGREGGRSKI